VLGAMLAVSLVATLAAVANAGSFQFDKEEETGTFTLRDGEEPVFSFVYKQRLKEGAPEQYRRTGYMHPLYDLDGKPITLDFPRDHYHHRGVWLSWPRMSYEGKKVQLWHPSPLRQQFDRWIKREIDGGSATVVLRTNWVLEGEVIGGERWRIEAHPPQGDYRAVDVKLTVSAKDKPIKLGGKRTANKGYGGLCIRTAASLANGRLLTDAGSLKGDAVRKRFRWADLATDERGLAVLAHPANPNSPPPWLLRNSYGGILNPEWPGLDLVTLEAGDPVTLRYRLVVHRGKMDATQLNELFKQWAGKAETQGAK
jgi:hypothetical protein